LVGGPPDRDGPCGAAGTRALVEGDGRPRLEFGLDVIVDGLDRYVER
jgi:hypothetical protein